MSDFVDLYLWWHTDDPFVLLRHLTHCQDTPDGEYHQRDPDLISDYKIHLLGHALWETHHLRAGTKEIDGNSLAEESLQTLRFIEGFFVEGFPRKVRHCHSDRIFSWESCMFARAAITEFATPEPNMPQVPFADACSILRDIVEDVEHEPPFLLLSCWACKDDAQFRASGMCRECQGRGIIYPFWLTATVKDLCRVAYVERLDPERQERFGVLDSLTLAAIADAIEDAGGASDKVAVNYMEHLRSPQKHHLGCWSIEQMLGKRRLYPWTIRRG